MKINDAYTQQAAQAASTRVESTPTPAARQNRPAAAPASSDEGSLSQLSSLVAKALEAPPPDRSSRVEALRQLYQSGAYEPDAAALTDALIDTSLK